MQCIPGAAFLVALLAALPALAGDLPDPTLTPGVVRDGETVETICNTRWGHDVRHVTKAMKQEVFRRYHMSGNLDAACVPDAHGQRCEVDHLISRELGGADAIENLWPQAYGSSPWNAHVKDRLENRLHVLVCSGKLPLDQAQHEIATDWISAYPKYVNH